MRKNRFVSVFVALTLAITSVFTVMPAENANAAYATKIAAFTYNGYNIPAYDGDPYEVVNNNNPKFAATEKTKTAFEKYSNLDKYGRVGVAYANVCKAIMPTGERGEIGSIQPSGWIQGKYNFVDGKYLYNRCHLIGWQLAGENANKKNLMTGTRSLNVDGMLPWENKVDDYVEDTNHHVLYRVTPVFKGTNKLATGVLIEAESVEDNKIEFCVFVYNVQKGVSIDYATGANKATTTTTTKNIKNASIKLSCTSYVYNGKAKTPKVTVKYNGSTLTKGTHYTVTYSKNKNVGTGLVTIKGKGKYTGTATRSFSIKVNKPTITSISKGKTYITPTWSKPYGATGYQVAYKRTTSDTYKKIGTTSRTKKITGLSKGKYYHVKVRAYKTVNGKKYYGNWSTVKKVKTNGTSSTNVVTSYVYVTETGSKYHNLGCSSLSQSKIKMTLSDAKAAGYEPCSRCH